MIGPGCDYVVEEEDDDFDKNDNNENQQQGNNNNSSVTTKNMKFMQGMTVRLESFLVEQSSLPILHAFNGHHIMLVGNDWSEWAMKINNKKTSDHHHNNHNHDILPPRHCHRHHHRHHRSGVLHQSPHNVPDDQTHVILVLD